MNQCGNRRNFDPHRPTKFYPPAVRKASISPVLECSVQDSLHSIFECSHCCPHPLQPVNVCDFFGAVPLEKKQDIKGGSVTTNSDENTVFSIWNRDSQMSTLQRAKSIYFELRATPLPVAFKIWRRIVWKICSHVGMRNHLYSHWSLKPRDQKKNVWNTVLPYPLK